MYYTSKNVKTEKAREWTYGVFEELDLPANKRAMDSIRAAFEPTKHFIHVDLIALLPKKKLITKAGEMSGMAIDITNWEKPLVDLVFLPKHRDKQPPFGVDNIGLDDKYIGSMTSKKCYWDQAGFKVQVDIVLKNIEDLCYTPEPDLGK